MKRLLILLLGFVLLHSSISYAGSAVKRYKSLTPSEERTLVLDGYVWDNSVDPLVTKIRELNQKDSRAWIYLVIRSGGGSIVAGNRLISAVNASEAPVMGIIDGYAYSMAAVIALYVDSLYMVENSDMMFHEAAYCACGLEQHVETRFNHNKKWINEFNAQVAKKLKMSVEKYTKAQRSELWLTADTAVQRNIARGVLKGISYKIPKKPDFFWFFMSNGREDDFILVDKEDIFYGKPMHGEKILCVVN